MKEMMLTMLSAAGVIVLIWMRLKARIISPNVPLLLRAFQAAGCAAPDPSADQRRNPDRGAGSPS